MAEILIASTTSAKQSSAITIGVDNPGVDYRSSRAETRPATFIAFGLGTAEYVDIQISNDGGTTFEDYYHNGTQQRLSGATADKTNALAVVGPGVYRADKTATAGAVKVSLSTPANP